jgi:hypothetical protein
MTAEIVSLPSARDSAPDSLAFSGSRPGVRYTPIEFADLPRFQAYAPFGNVPPGAVPFVLADVSWFEIIGDDMEPRFRKGNMVMVYAPGVVSLGDDVFIRFRDGTQCVKKLVRQTDDAITCVQYNPPAEIQYAAALIASVDLVASLNHYASGVERRAPSA